MFGTRFPRCPECGLPVLRDPARRRYGCHACGVHVPYAHDGAGDDMADFDQRGHHSLVVRHARPRFFRGDYTGAVISACGAFEGLVREGSGIDDYGIRLVRRAFGEGGALEVDGDGAARGSRRRRLESLCAWIVSGVRNAIAHEPESSVRIGRDDALYILGAISHICGQVDGARRRAGRGQGAPWAGGARHRDPMPKGRRGQGVRGAGAGMREPVDRVPRHRTLLGLPWLQAVGILFGIAASATVVIGTAAPLFR